MYLVHRGKVEDVQIFYREHSLSKGQLGLVAPIIKPLEKLIQFISFLMSLDNLVKIMKRLVIIIKTEEGTRQITISTV